MIVNVFLSYCNNVVLWLDKGWRWIGNYENKQASMANTNIVLQILKRPEGKTLSALENKRNVQVPFAFDDNLCNSKKVNHISNNKTLYFQTQPRPKPKIKRDREFIRSLTLV